MTTDVSLRRTHVRTPEPRRTRIRTPRRRRGRWGVRIADAGLAVAAVAGVLCIVLAIAAVVFDVRVTLFSTGSMSPTIPAGSAAVARGLPAADIRVGDVVTVERPGRLPITHRVTSVAPVPDGMPEARRITMRGDANAVEDPFPYDVERVRLVVFAVPGIAPVVAAAGTPAVMAAVTVAATALVVAVFWPRRRPGPRRRRAGSIAGAVVLVGALAASPPRRDRRRLGRCRRGRGHGLGADGDTAQRHPLHAIGPAAAREPRVGPRRGRLRCDGLPLDDGRRVRPE
ncbi:MAG: hypothetical protein PGN24_12005, partial [Microbacterium arborescens]